MKYEFRGFSCSGCEAGTSICEANSMVRRPVVMANLDSNSPTGTTHSLCSFGRSKRLKPCRFSP